MTLTPQWLDELRGRITLSTLIGRSVKVTRAGREYKACCPFHNEKTPSFTINDEKGFYHCFGCGAHGDAIRWMTEQRGLAFMDAVKELAATAGMEVPAADPRAAQRAEQQTSLRDVTQAAAEWFVGRLDAGEGAGARDYLTRRGISSATARAFGIGLAPDSRSALKSALSRFPVPMLVETGMLIAVDEKEPYDRFRGRLMIPIRDARGRVIAFGGRILGDGEPKYLNSPDTPLFDKGRTLYNLDRASPASRKTGRVIVVEGYMDVIGLAQAGIDDAVAPLGTALTEQQLQMLWRMVPVPVLCFDGDAAGQKAAMRAAMRALPLLRPGFSLAFATLPAGQDPDDVVRSGGKGAFEALVTAAEPLVDRLWSATLADTPTDTPEQRALLKQKLSQLSASIGDRDVADHYRDAFRQRHDDLFFQRRQPSGSGQPRPPFQPVRGGGRWRPDPAAQPPQPETRAIGAGGLEPGLAAPLLGGLLRYPDRLVDHADALTALRIADPADAALLDALLDATIGQEKLDTTRLLTILGPLEVYNRALTLLRADGMRFSFNCNRDGTADAALAEQARRDLDEMIGVATRWPELDAALVAATRRLGEQTDEATFAEQQRLRDMKADLVQRLSALREAQS